MQYSKEAVVWLAKTLDCTPISAELSLWQAIRNGATERQKFASEAKLRVYVTGEPEHIYELTDLFHVLPSEDVIIDVFKHNPDHRVNDWFDITYVPPKKLSEIENERFTLFTAGRLPIWSRQLLLHRQVSKVISTSLISALARFPDVRQVIVTDFHYDHLRDDLIPFLQKDNLAKASQLYPTVPKHFALKLSTLTDDVQIEALLDEVAREMLNIYWLQNDPPLKQWMPYLLREIDAFLLIKHHYRDAQQALQQLERWGNRDKVN